MSLDKTNPLILKKMNSKAVAGPKSQLPVRARPGTLIL